MRGFNSTEKALLRGDLQARLLVTFYLDEGTYRFCDDAINVTNGTTTWIGASALSGSIEVRSGKDLSAEPVTLICDGNRMEQFGIADPARVLRDMMDYLAQQRRVDFELGLSAIDSEIINLVVPIYAGKINTYRMVDESISLDSKQEATSKLEIVIDALASRYDRATFRTRSHEDQQEISPGDLFYSFTADAAVSDSTLYWGKNAPYNAGGGFVGPYGRYNIISPLAATITNYRRGS